MTNKAFNARHGISVGSTPVDVIDNTGAVLTNAASATKLETARTIEISGDVVGSATFDGTSNINISTTVQPNSVALGTDTTGNYLIDVAAGTGVSVSHTQSEGSTATVSIGQAVGTTDNVSFNNLTLAGELRGPATFVIDPAAVGDNTGTVVIKGNLQIDGTTTTVNSTTVTIDDPVFTLGGDLAPIDDDTYDRGIEYRWYDSQPRLGFFGFDRSTGKFAFIPRAILASGVYSGTIGELDAKLDWDNILNKPVIDNTTYNILATTTTGGANLRLNSSGSVNDDVKLASGTNVTVAYTDDNTITISSSYIDTNTTYSVKATTQTNGASLDLDAAGSGSGTDSVTFLGSGGTTVTRTDADSITISSTSVGDATLTASGASAGATNTHVALEFSGSFSANATVNRTIKPVVGPALSALATVMTGAASTGFLKKSGEDSYTLDTSTYATSSHTHYIGTTQVQSSSANQAVTGITSITGGTAAGTAISLLSATQSTAAAISGSVTVASGASSSGTAGDVFVKPGDSTINSAIGGVLKLYGGKNTGTTSGTGGDIRLVGGESTSTTTSAQGGSIYIEGGSASATGNISKFGGDVNIDAGSVGTSGTRNFGSVYIGTRSLSNVETLAINIGNSSNTTVVNGTVKLPNVGTSGFVKLGAGGQLSADTNTYLTSYTETDTLSSVTGRGATTSTAITLNVGGNIVSTSTWEKWKLVTTGTTSAARQGSDGNGLNFTTNALWNGSAWVEDDNTKKKFAYIQHLGNGRHEFRTAPTGANIAFVTTMYIDETAVTFTKPTAYNGSTSGSTTLQASAVAGTTTITMPATTGTMALTSDIGNGTFGVSIGSAGATNTTVTWGTSTGFSANTSSNYTYDLKVGPALTALATLMATAGAGFIKRGATADTYTIDTNTYLTGNQSITLSGDITGTGSTAIATTLANSGVTAGTYSSVTVDAKGRVTAGTNPGYITSYSETDTLATVTGRGATTGTDITLGSGVVTSYTYFGGTTTNYLITSANGSLIVKTKDQTTTFSRNLNIQTGNTTLAGSNSGGILIKTGNATGGSAAFAGDISMYPGTSDGVAAIVSIQGGESASGVTSTAGYVTIKGGNSTTTTGTTTANGGHVYIYGGDVTSANSFTKNTGSVYIEGGGASGSGTITFGTINIGRTSSSSSYGTSAVNIGNSSITTTITGTVKLPTVGTSGFVKLGAGGQLSADTNTYLTAESDTLATVTGRGNSASTNIGSTSSTVLNLATAGNAGTWIGAIQDGTSGWSLSGASIGFKSDNTTYAAIGIATANGLLYFARTTASGVGTMSSWLEVDSGGIANFKRARPQWNGNGLALLSEAGTTTNSVTFTSSGGAAAGTTFNGSVARTIDYSTVGAAASGHNHQYNVNNDWLRDYNDDANVKLYGNSRQMAFRTDGTTEYASGVGGYPFAWMYGGDAAAQRIMLLNTTGDLWTSTNGWLSTALAGKQNTGSYLTSESDTLSSVMARGATTATTYTSTTTTPFAFQSNSNTGTYNQTQIYVNANNTSGSTSNGILIERGRLSDSSTAEIRYFTIAARGGQIQWQVDGSGNTTQTGSLSATSKSFLIPHPTKEGWKLRYGSLEGPENGVYIRGKLKGKNKIELPEYWTKLVDPDSITVTLTPIGKHQKLHVEDIADNVVTIGNDGLFAGEINCFFVVYGERVDIDKLVVEYE